MSKLFFIQLAIVFLILSSCSNPDEESFNVSEKKRKAIESDVINRFHAMIKYAEAGELENILSHFDPDGPGSYIDNGVRYTAFQDMAVHYRATWKISKQDYGEPVTKLHVLSPRQVLITSSSVLNTTNRDGVVFQPRPWALTTLWYLVDDQWFIHSFHQFEGELKPVEPPNPEKK